MRIVLDTNVLISGLLYHGPSATILELARNLKIELFTCDVLMIELHDVLSRRKFIQRLEQVNVTSAEAVNAIRRLARVIAVDSLPAPVCRDPDDDIVLATALSANAVAIVSGDRDLLILNPFGSITIYDPAAFVEFSRRM